MLFRPLSFPHPERLLWLATVGASTKDENVGSQEFLAWRLVRHRFVLTERAAARPYPVRNATGMPAQVWVPPHIATDSG